MPRCFGDGPGGVPDEYEHLGDLEARQRDQAERRAEELRRRRESKSAAARHSQPEPKDAA